MYVDKINEVGIVDQNAPKDYYIIRKKIEIKDENGSVSGQVDMNITLTTHIPKIRLIVALL